MSDTKLSQELITTLLRELNDELSNENVLGELFLVGGAVMCMAYNARASTRDVDALFLPVSTIKKAAYKIAGRHNLDNDWLNDAAKGFFSEHGSFNLFLEMSHLKVYQPQPEYLLAMKCLAMRLAVEYHDLSDVRYLLRYLNIEDYAKAVATITRYYPIERFPQKTLYALEEILTC